MMKNFAFVFPGQGSQSVGMLDAFSDHPAVRQTLDEASQALGEDLARLIREGQQLVRLDDGRVLSFGGFDTGGMGDEPRDDDQRWHDYLDRQHRRPLDSGAVGDGLACDRRLPLRLLPNYAGMERLRPL